MGNEIDSDAAQSIPSHTETKPRTAKRHHTVLLFLLVAILGLASAGGIYLAEQSKATKIVSQNIVLNTQASTLAEEIKQQSDINDGVVSPGAVYKDPEGYIGLVNGTITFTLPSSWKRVPASYCSGASIDSKAVCQDVAAIAPTSQVASNGTAKWSATIGVYNYSSSDGSAASWYESVDGGYPLTNSGTPSAINVSQSPINGNSALSAEIISPEPSPTPPDYTNAIFVIVHGSYAVVVNAQIQVSTAYGSANAYDYSQTYLQDLTNMMQTVRFLD